MTQSEWVLLGILVIVPLFDLAVASVLWWAVRRTANAPRTMVERAWVATAIWLGVSIVAALGLARASGLEIDGGLRTLILALAILLPSAVNALWLLRFLTGGFGDTEV